MARDRANKRQSVSFTRSSAEEIAAVVRAFRGGDRDQPPVMLPRAVRSGNALARGTFSGSWAKGGVATVTDAKDSTVTYSAKNYFASLTGTGTKACCIAYVAGEWILIAAEC